MSLATTRRQGAWLIFCLPALLAGCSQRQQPPAPPPSAVTIALPVRAAVADFRDYTGRVEAVAFSAGSAVLSMYSSRALAVAGPAWVPIL